MPSLGLLIHLPLFVTLFARILAPKLPITSTLISPFIRNTLIKSCNASLYHISNTVPKEKVASFYSVNVSQMKHIMYGNNIQDYLISVPCSCMDLDDNTTAYFYKTTYPVQHGDTSDQVSIEIHSGQAWKGKANDSGIDAKTNLSISLPCGCIESQSQTVVTYTVQDKDTLLSIASLLSSDVTGIQSLNPEMHLILLIYCIKTTSIICFTLLLYFIFHEGTHKRTVIILAVGISLAVTLLSVSILIIVVLRRKRSKQKVEDRTIARSMSAYRTFFKRGTQNIFTFADSERPVLFSPEEIEEATSFFNESRKIGEGGYESVYFGILGGKEVAIKKMRSNKSKEFFAELKVLCKIHHIDVVELQGYASGEDDLYLVYEYVQNGSLNAHLHDPLLKGHQPLSWTARTHIALDAAKDIKTSNILLDEGLRAKVADFGLVKLVARTNEGDFLATRLVGTPGDLPPESVKELQVTPKTDVFAFGVVLAELITGRRALICDSKETNKMKSLITVINNVFQDEHPEGALEAMAEIAQCCLSEDAVDRPEMREIVASLGGNSQVFSGLFNGR
ncbi:hypothetical protein ACJW31_03G142700 [Castanea mollissima]